MRMGRYHSTQTSRTWNYYAKLKRVCMQIPLTKLDTLNSQINHINLIPSQIIHEGNYMIKLTQHLDLYSPQLLKFANQLASSLQTHYCETDCNVVNIQLFEAHPFDNPESSSTEISQFQIQYQIIPEPTLVCWIPLDIEHETCYSLTTATKIKSTCPNSRYLDQFKVTQGVRGSAINTHNRPPLQSKDKVIHLKAGQMLIQTETSGPNQISGEVVSGQTFRMLAVTLAITDLNRLISKL